MSGSAFWGGILILAALVASALQIRRWRTRRIGTLQLAAGLVARAGFLFLGIIYAAELTDRWRRAPLVGLGIVGVGIVLNLAAGIFDNIGRSRRAGGDPDAE